MACVPLDHLNEVIKLVDDRNIIAEGIVGEEIEVILIVVVEIASEGNAAVDIVLLLFAALGEGVGVFLYLHIADAFAVAVAHIHAEAKVYSRGQSLAQTDIPLENEGEQHGHKGYLDKGHDGRICGEAVYLIAAVVGGVGTVVVEQPYVGLTDTGDYYRGAVRAVAAAGGLGAVRRKSNAANGEHKRKGEQRRYYLFHRSLTFRLLS